ncbi:hypothetical protein VNO77_27141 [Canavalia gladiata]|uniref:Uncharacterized protein n=1 Tax=Canavalia gladiata TaxID=3824 RepID=A0AAN9QA85_CANGL
MEKSRVMDVILDVEALSCAAHVVGKGELATKLGCGVYVELMEKSRVMDVILDVEALSCAAHVSSGEEFQGLVFTNRRQDHPLLLLLILNIFLHTQRPYLDLLKAHLVSYLRVFLRSACVPFCGYINRTPRTTFSEEGIPLFAPLVMKISFSS